MASSGFDTDKIVERVLLIGVQTGENENIEGSLKELGELVETAGALAVGTVIQNREEIHPVTYIGKGKIEEVRQLLDAYEATGVVCDDELSPVQMRELEDELQIKVMDRTLVILDIFAGRAITAEGKIQVELAQLKYRQARLTGLGRSLSRLGGGIGTRGPGEKKLEMDRRLIKDRIAHLNRELKDVQMHREVTRSKRAGSHLKVAAIVGYTNAGKSTLLNTLTQAGVLSENQLFATLDPTTRKLELPGKQEILLTDTVGFINKLPHHLIDAFKSTLEEAKYADYILHVVDASNPDMELQMEVVYETLYQLGVSGKKIITVFNKIDACENKAGYRDRRADETLKISARTGEGLDDLKEKLSDLLRDDKIYIERLYDYADAGKVAIIRSKGELVSEEFRDNGIYVKAYVPMEIYSRV